MGCPTPVLGDLSVARSTSAYEVLTYLLSPQRKEDRYFMHAFFQTFLFVQDVRPTSSMLSPGKVTILPVPFFLVIPRLEEELDFKFLFVFSLFYFCLSSLEDSAS